MELVVTPDLDGFGKTTGVSTEELMRTFVGLRRPRRMVFLHLLLVSLIGKLSAKRSCAAPAPNSIPCAIPEYNNIMRRFAHRRIESRCALRGFLLRMCLLGVSTVL